MTDPLVDGQMGRSMLSIPGTEENPAEVDGGAIKVKWALKMVDDSVGPGKGWVRVMGPIP